jgi:integrase
MASIARNKKGECRLFYFVGDKRRCVRLGNLPASTVKALRPKLGRIIAANRTRTELDEETATWLGELDSDLYDKLSAAGFVSKRTAIGAATLEAFLADYIKRRTKIKSQSREHLERTRDELVKFFGAGRHLSDISPGAAARFQEHLGETKSPNTVRRICGRCKQFFRAAIRDRKIRENPFADDEIDTTVQANKEREFDVTPEMAQKVLNACPNLRCQLIFALARYGGLRSPSEIVRLRWGDIDWELGEFTAHSPKTEHHEGKDKRLIPLFPELRQYLEKAFNAFESANGRPPKRDEYVIKVADRDGTNNFGPQMDRIIEKAGLTPWPKTFQNLRMSRASELVKEFGAMLAEEWIGHSALVAKKHYWRANTADRQKAAGIAHSQIPPSTEETPVGDRTQKCTQQPTESDTQGVATDWQALENIEKCEDLLCTAGDSATRQGFEP